MAQAMIVDVTEKTIQDMVIHNSQHLPVLLTFWAPNCEASLKIITELTQLAETLAGRFILAKLNTQAEKSLTEKFKIEQTPAFKIVIQGQVARDLGDSPIDDIRHVLEEFMAPDPSEELRAQANQAFAQGQIEQALQLLAEAAQADNTNFKVHLDLARMYYQTGHVEKAKNLINKLPDEAKNSADGKGLSALFKYTEIIADIGDIESIQHCLKEDPNHPDALYGLFAFLMLNNQPEQAIQTLLKLFEQHREFEDGTPQKALIEVFDYLKDEQPEMVTHYRRQFQNLIF